jgi:hypothetical protein
MTQLVWDRTGERRYEAGIDRGVLYPPDKPAVPWNGLISVAEVTSREVKSHYLDGVKYLDRYIPGAYSAKLQAFTYPDELNALVGTTDFAPGVRLHDQKARTFHLSYRTKIANDVDGSDHGYKVHILYNIMATQSDFTHETLNADATAQPFEWTLSGTPQTMFGIRPTSHISLDSRFIDPNLLFTIEQMIYGAPPSQPAPDQPVNPNDPYLPSLVDLLALVESS